MVKIELNGNRHWQGRHRRKVGGVIKFVLACSFGGGRVVRNDSVEGIVVEYFGLGKVVLQLGM